MRVPPPSLSINNATRDLEEGVFRGIVELESSQREDYYHRHVVENLGKFIAGVGIAISEYLLFSYSYKNHDISPPNYGHIAILISVAVCIPSVCCSLIAKRE